MACNPCIGIPCENPSDLAAGIDGAIYSTQDYSFLVSCPPLCECPPGSFPQTISILASTIPPVVPPIPEPQAPIILRLQGCTALITRTLNPTATQADIAAAAQSMQAEWAGQQALCDALLFPGVNCQPNTFVDIGNDAQNFTCCYNQVSCTIPANTYTQRLSTIGLTQSQIDAATAQIKANLNFQAQTSCCNFLHIFCGATETNAGAGNTITIFCKNFGATVFDSSSFQLCDINGVAYANSVTPTVNPGVQSIVISVSGAPTSLSFTVKYQGIIIFTDPNGSAFSRNVNVSSNCSC